LNNELEKMQAKEQEQRAKCRQIQAEMNKISLQIKKLPRLKKASKRRRLED
jgi:peptidoglycan hydrolase CwlO-like protein